MYEIIGKDNPSHNDVTALQTMVSLSVNDKI